MGQQFQFGDRSFNRSGLRYAKRNKFGAGDHVSGSCCGKAFTGVVVDPRAKDGVSYRDDADGKLYSVSERLLYLDRKAAKAS